MPTRTPHGRHIIVVAILRQKVQDPGGSDFGVSLSERKWRVTMKRKYRKINKRVFKRLPMALPVTVRFLGLPHSHPPLRAQTKNVSLEGFSIQLEAILKDGISLMSEGQERVQLIPFLVLSEKFVDLEITITQEELGIRATGRIVWYDFDSRDDSYYFKAGIFLEEMEAEGRRKWEDYVRSESE